MRTVWGWRVWGWGSGGEHEYLHLRDKRGWRGKEEGERGGGVGGRVEEVDHMQTCIYKHYAVLVGAAAMFGRLWTVTCVCGHCECVLPKHTVYCSRCHNARETHSLLTNIYFQRRMEKYPLHFRLDPTHPHLQLFMQPQSPA